MDHVIASQTISGHLEPSQTISGTLKSGDLEPSHFWPAVRETAKKPGAGRRQRAEVMHKNIFLKKNHECTGVFRSCWPAGAPCAPSLAARLVISFATIRRLALGLRLAHGFELWRNLAGACSFTNSCRCPSLCCSCLAALRRLRLEFFAQLLFLSIVLRPFSSAGLFEKRSSSTLTKHAFPCVAPAISPSSTAFLTFFSQASLSFATAFAFALAAASRFRFAAAFFLASAVLGAASSWASSWTWQDAGVS